RDADRMARFKREAQVLASLNHPNIASIYGLEESDGIRCLVLELVEGPTLAESIAAGPLPLEEALNIARQIAEALEAAHEKGIIHRDLKLANVKVTSEGTVKVLDFGLAKALEDDPSSIDISKSPTLSVAATQAGVILGTAAYMSPEQARGQAVDKRADIWAFGVVLYEMLSGKQTFQGETVSDVLAHVLTKEPEWDALPADVPPPIRKLLQRCLTRERKQRLQAIGEARIALADFEAGSAVAAVPVSVAVSAPRPTWRRALPWGFGATMALVAVLAVWSPWREAKVGPSPLRLDVNVSDDEPLFVNRGAAAVLSPDGLRLVFVAGTGQDRKLYLRALAQLKASPLSGTEGGLDPFFSPDGQWVAFFTGNKLKKVSVKGGAPLTLCDVGQVRGGTWGPDDTIVFAAYEGSGLSRVSAAGGEPEPLTVLDNRINERSHRWPFFLPNGRVVLFVAQSGGMTFDEAHIEAVVLETGERKLLHRGGTYPRYLPTGHLLFVREGTMFAAPFDLDHLEVTGKPVPVLDGFQTNPVNGVGQYAFSQTGTLVYLSGVQAGTRSSVVWVDRKGNLTPLVADKADYEDLRFSPDGRWLAIEVNMAGAQDIVWVYDIERGTMSRLTFGEVGSYNPVWTPDGRRLAYSSAEQGDRPNLFWKRADGVGQAERLTTSESVQLTSSWSPDGQVLLFNELDTTNSWDIRFLRVGENTEPETFLSTPFIERNAAFSPDGRWLAYESNESGEFQVYVRPFAGPGGTPAAAGKWQVSTQGGLDARWSADGRELLYRSGDKVMAVLVSAQGESFRAGKPRQLFSGPFVNPEGPSQAWDVALGGQRFVMLQPDTKEAIAHTHLNFIFNWFDELRRLVPSE
ncbi:MAG: protein kinase, partial [Candidatus Acidoferrales bacterium]